MTNGTRPLGRWGISKYHPASGPEAEELRQTNVLVFDPHIYQVRRTPVSCMVIYAKQVVIVHGDIHASNAFTSYKPSVNFMHGDIRASNLYTLHKTSVNRALLCLCGSSSIQQQQHTAYISIQHTAAAAYSIYQYTAYSIQHIAACSMQHADSLTTQPPQAGGLKPEQLRDGSAARAFAGVLAKTVQCDNSTSQQCHDAIRPEARRVAVDERPATKRRCNPVPPTHMSPLWCNDHNPCENPQLCSCEDSVI